MVCQRDTAISTESNQGSAMGSSKLKALETPPAWNELAMDSKDTQEFANLPADVHWQQ